MKPTIKPPYVYISGPLSAMEEALRIKLRAFYEGLGKICEGYGLAAHIPHLVSDPIKNADLTPKQVYDLDKSAVIGSCLVIAYIGIASLGVGAEIEMAANANIPVVLIFERDLPSERRISRLTRGSPNIALEMIIESSHDLIDETEIKHHLEPFLRLFKPSVNAA